MDKLSDEVPSSNRFGACSSAELQLKLKIWERCLLADEKLSEALNDLNVDGRLPVEEKILAQFDALAEESLVIINTPADLPRYERLLHDWVTTFLPAFEKQYAPQISKKELAKYRRRFKQTFGQWEGYIPGSIDPGKISARLFHWRAAAAGRAQRLLDAGDCFLQPKESAAVPPGNLNPPSQQPSRSTRDRSKWKPAYRQVVEEYERECRVAGHKVTVASIFRHAGIGKTPSNGYKALRGEREGYWRSIWRVCVVEKPHLKQNLTTVAV